MRQPFETNYYIASAVVLLALSGGMQVAGADVVISAKATANMDCGGGSCEPTAPDAVLNAKDLENLLAQDGNVRVMTTGQNVEATNIVVSARVATPDSTSLTLDAVGAITVEAPVSIGSNTAELELQSGTGGTLGNISFGPKGHITFGSISDLFNINGAVFQLAATLPDLAKAANARPAGFYALTNGYDASADGTYHSPPVGAAFTGYFEALGNTISNLKIKAAEGEYLGLFAHLNGNGGFGVVRNLRLGNASVVSDHASDIGAIAGFLEQNAGILQSSATGEVKTGDSSSAGGIVGFINSGSLVSSWSSAKVTAGNAFSDVGGLIGANAGTIRNSFATGDVSGGELSTAGGLVGYGGSITGCFATGNVHTEGGGATAGGLLGDGGGVENSYAEGNVSGTSGGGGTNALGGLIGYADFSGFGNYSTGTVTGGGSDLVGGVIGMDITHHVYRHTYWDTTTSGLAQGAGRSRRDEKLKGLTSRRLRSGLPPGFSTGVWTETEKINRGFPYLIDNPPPK
ncbi:MAG TPA: GLUG motif-containing protein [Rhizomicrobium sp.]|jgi:hypothetical protein|nr:GLUG motif-containing protein [Rhizomicrobium sp.]